MVPAIMITSAWRGVARVTSKPKREKSYLAEAVDIISMAQQLVPNTSGHSELLRAQLITSSSLLVRIPPPEVWCTFPGNVSVSPGWITSILKLLFYEHTESP